jgi:hypothetical protein
MPNNFDPNQPQNPFAPSNSPMQNNNDLNGGNNMQNNPATFPMNNSQPLYNQPADMPITNSGPVYTPQANLNTPAEPQPSMQNMAQPNPMQNYNDPMAIHSQPTQQVPSTEQTPVQPGMTSQYNSNQNAYPEMPQYSAPQSAPIEPSPFQNQPVQSYTSAPQQPAPQPQSTAPQQQEQPQQDDRIVDYLITQVIPTRFPNMPADQVVAEKDRLYKILESGIFETAYSQLTPDQKKELDQLMQYGAKVAAIQAFFIEKIPNIQAQLGAYMEDFVQKYLKNEI